MFELFRKKDTDRLTRPNVSMVRSRTRALIRFANGAESARSHGPHPIPGAQRLSDEWRAMTSGEGLLADSIAAAVSRDLSIHAIFSEVIQPVLEQAVMVSATAHGAVLRAVSTARGN